MNEEAVEKDARPGDAYGSDLRYHHIVSDEFVCSAPEDAPCRMFPTCECENWCCCGIPGESHDEGDHCCMTTTKSGQGCWIAVWVDAVGVEDSLPPSVALYDEDDNRVIPDGPVACDWADGIALTYVLPPGSGDADA